MNKKKFKNILLLNMIPNTVGDSLMLVPLANVLKSNFPKSRISITSTKHLKYLFKGFSSISEIIEVEDLDKIGDVNRSKFSKLCLYFKIIHNLRKKLKNNNYDLVIITFIDFPPIHIIPKLLNIKNSIGYKYPNSFFSLLLTNSVIFPRSNIYYNQHISKTILKLVEPLNLIIKDRDLIIKKTINKSNIAKLDRKLKKYKLNNKFSNIIIQPGAKWESKRWPKQRFIEVIKFILDTQPSSNIILVGNKNERIICKNIKRLTSDKVYNFAGKLALDEVSTLISISDLTICNDSGIAHLSSAVGTDTIIIYGSTDPKHSEPLGFGKVIVLFKRLVGKEKEYSRNLPKTKKYMELITSEEVINILKDKIK